MKNIKLVLHSCLILSIVLIVTSAAFLITPHESSTLYTNNFTHGCLLSPSDTDTHVDLIYDAITSTVTYENQQYAVSSYCTALVISSELTIFVSDPSGTLRYGGEISKESPVMIVNNNVSRIIIFIDYNFLRVETYYNDSTVVKSEYSNLSWLQYFNPNGSYAITQQNYGLSTIHFSKSTHIYGISSSAELGYVSFYDYNVNVGADEYHAVVSYKNISSDHRELSGLGYYTIKPNELSDSYGCPIEAYYVVLPVFSLIKEKTTCSVRDFTSNTAVLVGIELFIIASYFELVIKRDML